MLARQTVPTSFSFDVSYPNYYNMQVISSVHKKFELFLANENSIYILNDLTKPIPFIIPCDDHYFRQVSNLYFLLYACYPQLYLCWHTFSVSLIALKNAESILSLCQISVSNYEVIILA